MKWLPVVLVFCPSAIWAAVCEKGQAYGHSDQTGPFEEVARLIITPTSIALIAVTLLAFYLRYSWTLWLVAAIWLYKLYHRNFVDPVWLLEKAEYAAGEGCVGPMWLTNLVGVLLIMAILLISFRGKPHHA